MNKKEVREWRMEVIDFLILIVLYCCQVVACLLVWRGMREGEGGGFILEVGGWEVWKWVYFLPDSQY